jgi:CubicO group peptidase (beta-lactamase class C family)
VRQGLAFACGVVAMLAACKTDAPTENSPVDPPAPAPPADRAGLPISTPAAEGISDSALQVLITNAKAEQSDAVVILRNGKVVYEYYYGSASATIMAMSASKSFVGLAFGYLLADRKLASLDEPVVTQLPTFADVDPRKASITYRHLLSHTSGLDPTRDAGDIEAKAIESRTIFAPGTGWQYNNAGVDLLAALAGRLAGKPMDQYLNEKLFLPMGITSVSWVRDRRGVPLGAGEMLIRPLDLAKVGQAILDGGQWQGKPVIPLDWMTTSATASSTFAPEHGFLWWRLVNYTAIGITSDLLTQWRSMGAADSTMAKLQPLVAESYTTPNALFAAMAARLAAAEYAAFMNWIAVGNHIPYYRVLGTSPSLGISAQGWLGQYLTIFPEKRLVAVRMRRAVAEDYTSPTERFGYRAFSSNVFRLVP